MQQQFETHPSYGMLGFSRCSGSAPTALFGSSIKHSNTIVMTLKRAERGRNLHHDLYLGTETIVRAEMSYSQFAEAITSLNMGDGIPVTIRYTEKDGNITGTEFESKQEQFKKEFARHLEDLEHNIKISRAEIEAMLGMKKTINKCDRQKILDAIDRVIMEIGSNSKFIYSMFNQQMEKTVTEAKGEVEAFVQNKMHSIASAAIEENKDELLKIE